MADLHHKKDIKYQEDNYFTAIVGCCLVKYNMQPMFLDFCTYAWRNNNKSLGHNMKYLKDTNKEINLEMFRTNIMILEEVMFKYYDEGALPYTVACEWLLRDFLQLYFDCQIYNKHLDDYMKYLPHSVKGIKERLGLTNQGMLECIFADNGRMINSVYGEIRMFEPEDIEPVQRLEEFLQMCDPDDSL